MSGLEQLGIETIYRCEKCGKWSHAKRRPARHERFVADSAVTEPPANPIEYREPTYGPEGPEDNGGWIVSCGPFAAWTAVKQS